MTAGRTATRALVTVLSVLTASAPIPMDVDRPVGPWPTEDRGSSTP
jgi:hypothetical protein